MREPVVLARELGRKELTAFAREEGCLGTRGYDEGPPWWSEGRDVRRWGELRTRIRIGVLAEAPDAAAGGWVGDTVTAGRFAVAVEAPPGWPDGVEVACLAVPRAGEAVGRLPTVDRFAPPSPTHTLPLGAGHAGGGQRLTTYQGPAGSAWAVQDRGGWWLAHRLDATGRVTVAQATAEDEQAPLPRVAFLDRLGRPLSLVSEETDRQRKQVSAHLGWRQPRPAPVDAVLDLGPADVVRGTLAAGPLFRCHAPSAVCVWVTLVGDDPAVVDPDNVGRILALDAAGPHVMAVPPVGEVRWCPSTGWFEESWTGSTFTPDGWYAGGPAPASLDRYDVAERDGRLVVDLREWRPGAAASVGRRVGRGRRGRATCSASARIPTGRSASRCSGAPTSGPTARSPRGAIRRGWWCASCPTPTGRRRPTAASRHPAVGRSTG